MAPFPVEEIFFHEGKRDGFFLEKFEGNEETNDRKELKMIGFREVLSFH
jgi:hypothetical protein